MVHGREGAEDGATGEASPPDDRGAAAPCRSALFMPASSPRALAKGPGLAADAIIVDLEDAIAPEAKASAREAAVRALADQDYGHRLRALRVNGVDTEWHEADVRAAIAAAPDVVVLPKAESADVLHALADRFAADARTRGVRLWALVESPLAVLRAESLASVARDGVPLDAFLVGNNDLARASGMPLATSRTPLLPWLMTLLAAAKAYGLRILDGVHNDFTDLDAFALECAQGVAMGMDGKGLIHPAQIEAANRAWTPDARAVADARAVVAAFDAPEAAGRGALRVEGRMVERMHLELARRTLALAARLDRLPSA